KRASVHRHLRQLLQTAGVHQLSYRQEPPRIHASESPRLRGGGRESMTAATRSVCEDRLKGLSRSINRPSITPFAVGVGFGLGALRLPFLHYLRPVGDFYVALLQICVLPFLLATIPLALRSAMASGSASGAIRSLSFWVLIMLIVVAAVSVII